MGCLMRGGALTEPMLPWVSFEMPARLPAILVVEDEVFLRFVIAEHLRECGYQVIEASSGDEAVQLLQSTAEIDIVFSDVQMPGERDGFALAQWVRGNRPEIPIFLTSGDAKKAEVAKHLCESQPFFAKPYDVTHVGAHIRQHLEKQTCAL
jgi:CheY-like chemotaxis protein